MVIDPYFESAYVKGFDARLSGKDATDCPYRKLTEKWFDWLDGWKDQDHHLRGRDEALAFTMNAEHHPTLGD